ncbi:MAG: gamma-glutamyltransferase family protein [Planctomycetota bacterium]
MVCTSQPLAVQAGLEMLRRGGNAIDAAVAAAAALTVVEPTSNGIGGDNFALIWSGGKLHGLNASGRSPAALKRSDYDAFDKVPRYGWWGVTVPGVVSGWVAAIERFGKLPLETVLAPAIEYAARGYMVSPEVAKYWGFAERRYRDDAVFDAWRNTFLLNGRTPKTGELMPLPDHARTLEAIARTNGDAFYSGELASAMERAAIDAGAPLRQRDLEAHRAQWVDPISMEYAGVRLHEIPPNGQGIAALSALGMLKAIGANASSPDDPELLHLQIEAMKLAFADAHRYVADPATMDVSTASLLDPGYLAQRAATIDPSRAQDFDHGEPKPGGTVLLCTADADGNMVSFIQSNYTGFGSGVVVPGTGIALQNRGACFTLERGHPNELAPSKLPYHTIIPAFVTRDVPTGGTMPVMAYGVMGGFMQPQGHLQVLTRIEAFDQNPQAALDAPRWQVHTGKRVTIEPGHAPAVYEALRARGHELEPQEQVNASFGRGQAIYRVGGHGYAGASDQRADGHAGGF